MLEDALQMKINFLYCCLGELGENVHLDGASGAYNGLAPMQCRSRVALLLIMAATNANDNALTM